MESARALPLSVLIRTIGRPELLRGCLNSLASCDPRAAEILVVDQSGGSQVAEVVAGFAGAGARAVACAGRGPSLAFNVGLQAIEHDVVAVTDDDCTVAPDWVGRAWAHMRAQPEGIVTGAVLAAGDPGRIPSTTDEAERRDYTGQLHVGALFTGNMSGSRRSILAMGGFDERIGPAAEDNDFSYRWLRAGRSLRYEPDMVVWHHEWRSRSELERWYAAYASSQGLFYAKHLLRGDGRMLGFILRDLHAGVRGLAAHWVRGRPRWSDPRQAILRGLPLGLARGLRAFRSGPRAD